MRLRKNKTKYIWFKKVRGSYLPVSWQGWLSYIPMIYIVVASLIIIIEKKLTVAETLLSWFPYLVCVAVAMHWLAAKTSK